MEAGESGCGGRGRLGVSPRRDRCRDEGRRRGLGGGGEWALQDCRCYQRRCSHVWPDSAQRRQRQTMLQIGSTPIRGHRQHNHRNVSDTDHTQTHARHSLSVDTVWKHKLQDKYCTTLKSELKQSHGPQHENANGRNWMFIQVDIRLWHAISFRMIMFRAVQHLQTKPHHPRKIPVELCVPERRQRYRLQATKIILLWYYVREFPRKTMSSYERWNPRPVLRSMAPYCRLAFLTSTGNKCIR